MSDELKNPSPPEDEAEFIREVSAQAARKLKFQKDGSQGRLVRPRHGRNHRLVGRCAYPRRRNARPLVGPPTSGTRSWTLMLLAIGLVVGCANAWHWVTEQDDAMHDKSEHKDE